MAATSFSVPVLAVRIPALPLLKQRAAESFYDPLLRISRKLGSMYPDAAFAHQLLHVSMAGLYNLAVSTELQHKHMRHHLPLGLVNWVLNLADNACNRRHSNHNTISLSNILQTASVAVFTQNFIWQFSCFFVCFSQFLVVGVRTNVEVFILFRLLFATYVAD